MKATADLIEPNIAAAFLSLFNGYYEIGLSLSFCVRVR